MVLLGPTLFPIAYKWLLSSLVNLSSSVFFDDRTVYNSISSLEPLITQVITQYTGQYTYEKTPLPVCLKQIFSPFYRHFSMMFRGRKNPLPDTKASLTEHWLEHVCQSQMLKFTYRRVTKLHLLSSEWSAEHGERTRGILPSIPRSLEASYWGNHCSLVYTRVIELASVVVPLEEEPYLPLGPTSKQFQYTHESLFFLSLSPYPRPFSWWTR